MIQKINSGVENQQIISRINLLFIKKKIKQLVDNRVENKHIVLKINTSI